MKNDLRVIKTKASLHEALIQLLNEKSLDKIKISELCKVATINRGTFYLHYKDVPELFDELFNKIIEDLKAAYYEPYILTGHKIEKLKPEMVRIFHHVLKFKSFYKIVFDRKTPLIYYFRLFEVVYEYIEDSSKHIDKDETTRKFHASYQTNAIIGMVISWVGEDFKQSPEALNELLLKFTKFSIE